jgi:hypothetical protein
MAADIKAAGALAGIVRYGIPWHGRIEGGVLYTGKLDALDAEITRAGWAQPASSDCWLIMAPQKQTIDGVTSILPGTTLPDPYLDAPAQKLADAAEGKELTNWAMLSGAGDIYGKPYARTNDYKHRWIWVDDTGTAYAVEFGLVAGTAQTLFSGADYDGFVRRDWAFSGPITARFRFTRFGELSTSGEIATATVVDYVIAADGLDQAAPVCQATGGNMILRDLSPHGHKALMEVHSLNYDTNEILQMYGGTLPLVSHRECSNPLGFVEFSLSGTGAAPVVGMSVVAGRAATFGAQSITVTPVSDLAQYVCVGVGEFTVNIDRRATGVVSITDRIFGYHYDAAGALVPHKMSFVHNQSYSEIVNMGATATIDVVKDYTVTYSIGAHSWTMTRTRSATATNDGATYSGNFSVSGNSGAEDEPSSGFWDEGGDVTDGKYLGTYSDNYGVCGTTHAIQGTSFPYLVYPPTSSPGQYAWLLTSGGEWWPETLMDTLSEHGRMKIMPFRLGRAAYNLSYRIYGGAYYAEYGSFKSSLGTITESAAQKSWLSPGYVLLGGFDPRNKVLLFPKAARVAFS